MKKNGKRFLLSGAAFLGAFVLWTLLIQIVDVQPVGQNGTDIGFAAFNSWFHKLIGVHMTIYTITDWLGLVPLFVCIGFGYAVFEMIPVNYRPVLINGIMEASYPSSTTLLVLSVMPTLAEQMNRRLKNTSAKRIICVLTVAFSAFMVIGRLISGVHWFTDIIGGVLLSVGLFCMYKAFVLLCEKKKS